MTEEQQPQQAEQPQGLPDPGPPIILVMKTTIDGESSIQYSGSPEWASAILRGMADKIDSDALLM